MTSNPAAEDRRGGHDLLALLTGVDFAQSNLAPEDVHRVRIAIKQTRAWLKLCRSQSGKTASYQQLLANLRTLSASLAGRRDRDVALQTLAKLAHKYPGKKTQHLVDVLRQELAGRQPPAQEVPELNAVIEQIRQDLLPCMQLEIPPVAQRDVFRRTYAKMCKQGKAALKSEVCAELHAWRKLAKTAGYQLAMVELNEAKRHKLAGRLSRLGKKLGAIHDLCFLQDMIEEITGRLPHELDWAPLHKRIAKERNALIAAVSKIHRQVCRDLPHVPTGPKIS